MRFTIAASLAALFALPSVASAEGFEAIVIGNADVNGSHFYMVSLRQDLRFGEAVDPATSGRNAASGLRLRFDATQSTYESDYDATPGTGTGRTYRLLLSYGFSVGADTVMTLTGGLSHRTDTVRPVTLSSPADEAKTAEFVSLDFEYSPSSFGALQALLEHDGSGANFASATYLFNVGQNFRIGPTVNYIAEGDYSRDAYGISALYVNGDQFEIKATLANASQVIGSSAAVDVDYLELQLRTTF